MVGDFRIKIGPLMLADFEVLFFQKLTRLRDEFLGSLFIFVIGLRQAPVGHRAARIVSENGPERSFGFVIPKPMKLPQSLIKISLPLIPTGSNGQMNITSCAHQRTFLTRAFIESMAIVGMPLFDILIRLLRQQIGGEERKGEKSLHDRCL